MLKAGLTPSASSREASMRRLFALVLAFGLAASGALSCRSRDRSDVVALPLVDAFRPENVERRKEPATPVAVEWRFAALAADRTWAAGPGTEGVEVRDGELVGTASSPRPVIELAAPAALGGGDVLHSIEVRLRVSAGSQMTVNPLDDKGLPTAAFGAPTGPAGIGTPLLPGDETRTYSMVMAQSFVLGGFARQGIRRVVLRPTDAPGATFAVESVRLVFRRAYLAGVPSGLGWHGLGEVWRESLVSRPGEVVHLPVRLPERPLLDLAIGTIAGTPVAFRVAVRDDAGEEHVVLRHTVTTADRWHVDPVALDRWAGKDVELLLRAETEEVEALAFWGSPVVRSRGAGPAAPDAERPQGVVLVIADTLRRDHLEPWGYERATGPNVRRLASEGVHFQDAVAQAVWTKVSVPSILSSLYPSTHGIVDFTHRLPATATTLAEAFRSGGYATFATSAIPFTGQLTNLHQGVEVLHESRSFALIDGEYRMKSARDYVGRALDFIEQHREVPFFVVLHVADPHAPYQPFEPYDRLWTDEGEARWFREAEQLVLPHIPASVGARRRVVAATAAELALSGVDVPRFVRHEKAWYDGSIRGMDAEIGRLLDRLEHLGLSDRVAVAFVSDHGEEFLEHGSHWHGQNVYGENANVPFLLWGPGFVPAGVKVAPTVQLVDVMPTLLDLAGLPQPERAQGRSLLPLVTETAAGRVSADWARRPAFTERALRGDPAEAGVMPGFAIVKDGWKLVHHVPPPPGRPERELYDHRADPLNRNDVAAEHPELVAALAAELDRWREWTLRQRLPAEDAGTVDAAELERLRSLGYVN
jgi:arylsulfatase A-like enzyme